MRSLCLPLAASLAASLPSLALAQKAAPAAQPTAQEVAAPHAQGGRRFVDLHDLSCEQYMALDDTLRPPVVWYIAGDYKSAGPLARSFDPDLVAHAGAHVWGECKNHPQANLRYVVVGYFKEAKVRSEEQAAKRARDAVEASGKKKAQ